MRPLIPWTTPNRTEFEAFDATCARSGWADWLVKGIDQLFTEYDLDGIYFDGTSEAFRCGTKRPTAAAGKKQAGKLQPGYPC